MPGNETVLVEQNDWSEERNINPYAVFDKPPAMLQITPNLGRRGQTGIAVTGINFTPSKSSIVLRCDGQVLASNLISDEAGRVSASFTIPTNARNGNRIVEMADGVYSARASLQINDPLVITRIERIIENRIIRVPVVRVRSTPPVVRDPRLLMDASDDVKIYNDSADLFSTSRHLVQTTSLLRYPVFVKDDDYRGTPDGSGSSPPDRRSGESMRTRVQFRKWESNWRLVSGTSLMPTAGGNW